MNEIVNVKRNIDFDKGFFSKWSNELAWWMGSVHVEGVIKRGTPKRHQMTSHNTALLEQMKALLKLNSSVEYSRNVKSYSLPYPKKEIEIMLQELGDVGCSVFPRQQTWPSDMPLCYRPHYVRGVVESGCELKINDGIIEGVYIVCPSRLFINGCVKELDRNGIKAI